ncbi:MAG: hypothetical protein JW731_07585 [Bacteroidales bacterium]|nr:hypothetical protein [Bacteroidales bacterium]
MKSPGTEVMEGRETYLSLHWQVTEPDYIDAGTGSIPSVFYWGEFYKIRPGYYNLYYEGAVWTGMTWAFYAWEVSYEIWEIQGEQGDWYYNGANGPDNFFTIVCSPYGPAVNNSYKSGEEMSYETLSETDNEIIIKQTAEGFEMIITYKKSNPIKNIKTEQSIK